MLSFKHKVCLITGAANGIGRAVSKRFAEAGAQLILVDIDEKGLKKLKQDLDLQNTAIKTFVVDLSKKAEIDQLWSNLKDIEVDTLVNNAGTYPFYKFLELTENDLQKVMDLNLNSVVWMCQAFISRRLKKGGSIVNIGSIEAILPFKKDLTQYSMAKVGVITLTRDLAREFAKHDIRINAILPGGIVTRGTKNAAISTLKDFNLGLISDGYNFKQRIPLGRMGEADEVAKVIIALCSDLSSYIHGALIPVDGGFLSS